MTFLTLDHAGFTVSDLDRSVAWYSHLLGTEPTLRKRSADAYMGKVIGYEDCEIEYAYFPLPGSASMLELVEYTSPPSEQVSLETSALGNGHLCILVDDLHAEFERLSEHAVFRSAAPVELMAGANRGGWSAYLRDPDGITIQLLQKPADRDLTSGALT